MKISAYEQANRHLGQISIMRKEGETMAKIPLDNLEALMLRLVELERKEIGL